MTNAESYAGSILTFDDYGTPAVESADLSALTDITLGLALSPGATGDVYLEIEDVNS